MTPQNRCAVSGPHLSLGVMPRKSRRLTGFKRSATVSHGLRNPYGIAAVETIAVGTGIREIARLRKRYGQGRWRKRRGFAEIKLTNGDIVEAEIHWYEATGIGKR